MTHPLNDDGSVPQRRRLQLVLRVTGDKSTEVSREVKPLWTKEVSDHFHETADRDADPKRQMMDSLSKMLVEVASESLPEMLEELMALASRGT